MSSPASGSATLDSLSSFHTNSLCFYVNGFRRWFRAMLTQCQKNNVVWSMYYATVTITASSEYTLLKHALPAKCFKCIVAVNSTDVLKLTTELSFSNLCLWCWASCSTLNHFSNQAGLQLYYLLSLARFKNALFNITSNWVKVT